MGLGKVRTEGGRRRAPAPRGRRGGAGSGLATGRRADSVLRKRRGGDSNPRYGLSSVYRFSKPTPSASRPPLRRRAQYSGAGGVFERVGGESGGAKTNADRGHRPAFEEVSPRSARSSRGLVMWETIRVAPQHETKRYRTGPREAPPSRRAFVRGADPRRSSDRPPMPICDASAASARMRDQPAKDEEWYEQITHAPDQGGRNHPWGSDRGRARAWRPATCGDTGFRGGWLRDRRPGT